MVYCSFSPKTWFKNKHFSDADGDKAGGQGQCGEILVSVTDSRKNKLG